jgi:hypothetical protein
MSEVTTRPGKPLPAQSKLSCRLRTRQLRRGHSLTAGQVELENTSPDVLEIEVHSNPLQYLNLIVTDEAGNIFPTTYYGDFFAPLSEPYMLRLGPGEKFTGPVGLLGNLPQEKRLPGTYTVRAVYEYHGLKAVSEPLEVRLPAGGG